MNFSKKNNELHKKNRIFVSKKSINFSIALLVAFLIVSCTSTSKTVTTTATAAAVKEVPLENSLLWKISGKGLEKPSYLYGTIHMTCNYKATDKIVKAFAETSQLALEIDMDDPSMQAKMMKGMMMKEGTTMKNLLSEEDYTQLASFFKDNTGMSLGMFNTIKPFAVSAMLISKLVPCNPPSSYEAEFMKIAQEQKEEVKGLETIEYQMGVFDSIPYKDQLDDLVKMAKEGLAESKSEFEKLNMLYDKEDIEGMMKIMTENDDVTAKFTDELLNKRNKNWIPVIEKMSKEMPTFYGVGAMHLAGDEGVIRLLRKAGFTVTAVN
jgi:uncharacterized protein YbaP (TraB family)